LARDGTAGAEVVDGLYAGAARHWKLIVILFWIGFAIF
jgi:hypothetical protein